jgi:TPR repeat protein
VKGIVAGGGLALVLAAGLLYLLSPRSTAQSGLPVTKVSNDGPPVQVIPQAQNNPYFVDQRRPTTTVPLQPSDVRQGQPPGNASSRPGSGGRGPFEVAAEPQNPGPAAGNQPTGPSASNMAPQGRAMPPANNAPAQNSGSSASVASTSTPSTAADAANANSGSAPAASETTPQVAATDTPESTSKPARVQTDGRKVSEKEVLAAYEAKNYANARELAEPCAKDGNPDCQFIMGRILETGSAGPKDPGRAVDWYLMAGKAGSAKARNNLGGLYYRGEGVPKDSHEAAKWFAMAASQDYADAQFNLAALYETGDGVTKNLSEARRLYTIVAAKAADKQLAADAQEALDRLNGRRKR